jgi:hypothetical protein
MHYQPFDHGGDEGHLCAARTHTCGAPCGLQVDGNLLCTQKCVADWQVSEIFVGTVNLSGRSVTRSMNGIAALWHCLAQLNASCVTASVPLEIIFMHSRRVRSIYAGGRPHYHRFLFSNLLFNF